MAGRPRDAVAALRHRYTADPVLLRHTLLYLPAQLLAPLAQFIAAVVWTHLMSPETYGVLTFLVAAQDLVFVLCLSWWSAFCLRYMAGFNRADLEVYRRSEATVLALTIAVGAAVSVMLLGYLHLLGEGPLVVVTIVFLVSRSVDVHFAERARAQERIFDTRSRRSPARLPASRSPISSCGSSDRRRRPRWPASRSRRPPPPSG